MAKIFQGLGPKRRESSNGEWLYALPKARVRSSRLGRGAIATTLIAIHLTIMCVYIYIYIYTHYSIRICICICICICIYIYIYVYIHTHTYNGSGRRGSGGELVPPLPSGKCTMPGLHNKISA